MMNSETSDSTIILIRRREDAKAILFTPSRLCVGIIAILLLSALPRNAAAQNATPMGLGGSGVAISYLRSAHDATDYFCLRANAELVKSKTYSISALARYQYINSHIPSADLAATGYTPQELNLDGSHQVYQLGLNSFTRSMLWGRPLMTFAMVRADFSSFGFGRVNAMGAAMLMLKATRTTQFGLGPMLLLNTSSSWPIFPMFIYRRQFSDKLAMGLYGAIFSLDYTPTRVDLLSVGFDIDARSFYFRPETDDLPDVCRYTKTLFRPMAKYRHHLTKHLSAEIEGGVELKMSSRIYGRTGTHHYLETDAPASPFVLLTINSKL